MKRFSQSLTAVAMASALALGGATVAQAQIPAPATITVDGVEYYKKADGSYESAPLVNGETNKLTAEQAQAEWEKQQENTEGDDTDGDNTDGDNTEGDDNTEGEGNEETPGDDTDGDNTEGDNTGEDGIPAPATKVDKDGNTCYQHLQDKTVYVKDRNKVNEPITDEMRAECDFGETTPDDNTTGSDKKNLAWLALPAALIIGGIVWHLANDGKTYVQDENSKDAPSEEEKAASDKMLAENKDEVIAQGGQLAGEGAADQGAADESANDRGMLAQTGSNTAARGLAGLAVIAMIAAGAFAVRRKLFA